MGINTIDPGHGQTAQSVYKKDTNKDSSKPKKEDSAVKTALKDKITISTESTDMTKKAAKIAESISLNPVVAMSALNSIAPEKLSSLLSAA